MVAQPGGLSATPPSFVSPAGLLRVHSFNQLMKMLNDIGPVPLGYTASDWPPDGLCATDQNLLSLAIQPGFDPCHSHII